MDQVVTLKRDNKFISLEEVSGLQKKDVDYLYRSHVNSSLYSVFKILGFSSMDIEKAQGTTIYLKNGQEVLDFTSACGTLNLGHNHPDIIQAEKYCHEMKFIDCLKFGVNKLQAVLAHNIASLLPEPLDTSFFTVSGAEANEAAIKLATRVQGESKKYFIRTNGSFHGKTHGALAFTESENFAKGFHLGFPKEQIISIDFNSINQLKEVIKKHPHQIAGIIVEPIQGQDIVVPEKGYLRELVSLCRQENIITIFDEFKIGLGRTGDLFYFFQEDTVPDILTLSKALAGSKRPIGAMVTSKKLWNKAYGKKKDSTLHSSTFTGLGESCAVGIKTLEIISHPEFLSSVKEKSSYFFEKLNQLKEKYPQKIKGIRGAGLIIGIEFNFPATNSEINIPFVKNAHIAMSGSIVRELLLNHNILTYFNGSSPEILNVMPPLTVSLEEIDQFIESMDKVLSTSFTKLISKFCKGAVL